MVELLVGGRIPRFRIGRCLSAVVGVLVCRASRSRPVLPVFDSADQRITSRKREVHRTDVVASPYVHRRVPRSMTDRSLGFSAGCSDCQLG
jgi:hypothetical protein